jgi:HupE/UreJ protein
MHGMSAAGKRSRRASQYLGPRAASADPTVTSAGFALRRRAARPRDGCSAAQRVGRSVVGAPAVMDVLRPCSEERSSRASKPRSTRARWQPRGPLPSTASAFSRPQIRARVRRALPAIAVSLALLALLAPSRAHAHQSSVKYVDITADGSRARVRVTVAPADLTAPLGLSDASTPSVATAAVPAAAAYVARWLALSLPDGAACEPAPAHAAPDPDGRLVAVMWEVACPEPIERLRIDLAAFFAADARHVALVTLHPPGERVDPHVVRADEPVLELHSGQAPSLASWIAYGAHHISGGPDHVCFVLALLLVVVIARGPGLGPGATWQARRPLEALRSTAVIVTSFTIAHSLTLAAASLGWIRLPGRLVESLIAASILYTAIENVVRPDVRHRFAMTFGFGLVHGLGFASVLEARLPPENVIAPLLGFNLGVELGQLAIVAIALPVLAALARALGATRYRRIFLAAAAVPLSAIATKWLIERAFGM